MRSISWPLTPTNGLPSRSSSAPGASPTIMTGAPGAPSANTVFLAVRLSAQPSKPRIAASSSASVLQRSASARASSTSCGDSSGTGARGRPEAARAARIGVGARAARRAGGALRRRPDGGGAAKRSIGSSPIASSTPCSTYQRSRRESRAATRLGHHRLFMKAPRIGAHIAASAWLAMWPLFDGSST